MDKNLKLTLKNYTQPLNQRGYLKTLTNKGFELAEKIPQRELRNPKKLNEKPLAYVATYNKNNLELFTEKIKNLEELKNNDKIKEILDTTKVIKSQTTQKS